VPAMSRVLNRYATALPLLALVIIAAALATGPERTQAHHLCGNTGSPFGPFDLQTYEAADYRNVYARTMELAGSNQLFPEHGTFALPGVEGVQPSPYIPPVLLKSIAWLESGWAQGSYDPLVQYGEIGPVLSSHDCGYGIMQVTSGMQNISGMPNLDQAMIGGHYAFNIARGARILADKWNLAPEYRPIVGSRNTQIIEDWYYALWGYNGFASSNHPLNKPPREPYRCDGSQARSAYPYQELVLGCVANPPWRGGAPLWPAQAVQLPNLADPAFSRPDGTPNWDAFNACIYQANCGYMNIPTPNPWHTDPTSPPLSRGQVIGTPSLSLSTTSLSLAAVPGGESLPADVTISNVGSGVLAWRATPSVSWLRISRFEGVSLGPDLGGIGQTLRIHANSAGLSPGTYTGVISVESLYSYNVPAVVYVTLVVDIQAASPQSGDFNGDGRSDLVFPCCSDYASLWLSNGSGGFAVSTFQPWPGYGMSQGSWQTGDFNGDGKTDLIHLTPYDYAHAWLSKGDGTFIVGGFRPWPRYGMSVGSWQSGDFNGDGKTDLVHLTPFDYVHTWLSNGDGSFNASTFRPWPGYGVSFGSWLSGDFNGDGKTDLVQLTPFDYVHPWLSNGDGSFSVGFYRPWPGYGVSFGSWQSGDFNDDDKTDLIHLTAFGYAHPWLSNGDGGFSVISFQPWTGYGMQPGSWQSGDFNGDGETDLIHLTGFSYAHPWLSNGDGSFSVGFFQPWPGYGMPSGLWKPGDFDGDGKTDVMHLCCTYVHIWWSRGDSSFTVTTFRP